MSGLVVVRGVFGPNAIVRLTRAVNEHALRPDGLELVAEGTADEAGIVTFTDGIEVGARFFVSGLDADGRPVDVRVRGIEEELPDVAQPKVKPDRERRVVAPAQVPTAQAPARRQEDVPPGTPQRSDTATGTAEPVD